MGNLNFVENMIEQKLLSLHTAYLAKVLSVSGDLKTAKIQPLGKTKAYGEAAVSQSPLTDVPVVHSARYKYTLETLTHVTNTTVTTTENSISYVTGTSISTSSADGYLTSARAQNTHGSATFLTDAKAVNEKETKDMVTVVPIAPGDIVVCVCCERNIADAKNGKNSTPPAGHHSMSDSIIVGIL